MLFWQQSLEHNAAALALPQVQPAKDADDFVRSEVNRLSQLFLNRGVNEEGTSARQDALGTGVASLLLTKEIEKKRQEEAYKKRKLIWNGLKNIFELDKEDPWKKYLSMKDGLTLLPGPLQIMYDPAEKDGDKFVLLELGQAREAKNLLNCIKEILPSFTERVHFSYAEIAEDKMLQQLTMSYKRLEEIWAFHMKRNQPRNADAVLGWVGRGTNNVPEESLLSILTKIDKDKGTSKGKCFNCGIAGHTQATCRRPAKKDKSTKREFTQGGEKACYICGAKEHMADKCAKRHKGK
jgi:hypothetical protein